VDYTPYEGLRLQGNVDTTILRGNLLVQNGVFSGQRSTGIFLAGKLEPENDIWKNPG